MPSEVTWEVTLAVGHTHPRQRGSGHSVVLMTSQGPQTQRWETSAEELGRGGNRTVPWRGEGERATSASPDTGRAVSGKWRAEPRPEPDSGKPTVRDRRGACRNVNHGGTRHPLDNRKGTLGSKYSSNPSQEVSSGTPRHHCVGSDWKKSSSHA